MKPNSDNAGGAPSAASDLLALRLKPGEEDRLLGGHQWVFSNELAAGAPDAEPGRLAALVTSQDRFLGMGFYNPHSLIAWRFLSRRVEPVDAAFFRARLESALALRTRLYPGERSFRLAFGESDGLPGLVIDKYEDVLVLQVLSAGMERCLEPVAEALQDLLKPRGIYLSNDHSARALEGLKSEKRVLRGDVPAKAVIEEAGIKYATPLTEGQKTGFYFDQRDNRARLAPYVRGRRVLDLFCYTGAFSLAAARNGAAKVLGLDSSAPAVELARENARLNGLEPLCDFDAGDAEEVLRAFGTGPQPFSPDMILVDPPSYAPSKRHLPKALRAYAKLNSLALRCLSPGGFLASSTCSHHVDREAFVGMLRQAAARAQKRVRLLELGMQSRDHPVILSMPETEYLHFALLEVCGQ